MAFEVTLPEEFCTEVIYCFSTAEVKKEKEKEEKKVNPQFWCLSKIPTLRQYKPNIYKGKAESKYIKEKKNHKEDI